MDAFVCSALERSKERGTEEEKQELQRKGKKGMRIKISNSKLLLLFVAQPEGKNLHLSLIENQEDLTDD